MTSLLHFGGAEKITLFCTAGTDFLFSSDLLFPASAVDLDRHLPATTSAKLHDFVVVKASSIFAFSYLATSFYREGEKE
jgi:hypothetical protein